MSRGKLITIEGTEGAGKSTALKYIQTYLSKHGIDVVVTREPGGTPIAEEIRKVLLHTQSTETLFPETELLLMFAGRSQHVHECIVPALHAGKWVLSDRYIDASYAYQGGGRGIDMGLIATLDKYIVGSIYPDLTLLLDLPPEVGMKRAEMRGSGKDRIEQEKIEFFSRVRETYLERAKQESKRIQVIDASTSAREVELAIQAVLENFWVRH